MFRLLIQKKTFYCKTDHCPAKMTIVNSANPKKAYFRRYSKGPEHISTLCSADGFFDPTKYNESKFNPATIFDRILSTTKNNQTITRGAS